MDLSCRPQDFNMSEKSFKRFISELRVRGKAGIVASCSLASTAIREFFQVTVVFAANAFAVPVYSSSFASVARANVAAAASSFIVELFTDISLIDKSNDISSLVETDLIPQRKEDKIVCIYFVKDVCLAYVRKLFKFQVSFHCVGTTTTSAISAHVPAELTLKRFLILGSVCSMCLVTYDTVYTQAQLPLFG
jgi:hypothetical protein